MDIIYEKNGQQHQVEEVQDNVIVSYQIRPHVQVQIKLTHEGMIASVIGDISNEEYAQLQYLFECDFDLDFDAAEDEECEDLDHPKEEQKIIVIDGVEYFPILADEVEATIKKHTPSPLQAEIMRKQFVFGETNVCLMAKWTGEKRPPFIQEMYYDSKTQQVRQCEEKLEDLCNIMSLHWIRKINENQYEELPLYYIA